jgi:hypothetical protein
MELVDFESNPMTVKQVLDSVRSFVHLPATTVSPSWLGEGGAIELDEVVARLEALEQAAAQDKQQESWRG